ncbi:MAG: hypothetical protein KDD51_11805 [Bdellovibrionales bacterium]|nr:hypothetical protein [Bdellovibrionales bacterium]
MAACFRAMYRLGLRVVSLVLRSNPSIDAILLRRPGVLKDAFAGESDLDLTLLVNDRISLPQCQHRLSSTIKWLRRSIPFCGEFWIIRSLRWKEHAVFRVTDYTAPLGSCVVFSRIALPFVDFELSRSEWKKKQRERMIYSIPGIREGLFGKNRIPLAVASRRLCKLRWRETWVNDRARAALPSLKYAHRHPCFVVNAIVNETERLLDTPNPVPDAIARVSRGGLLTIKTEGTFEGLGASLRKAVLNAFAPIQNANFGTPVDILCFPLRPYKFQNAVFVITEGFAERSRLNALLKAAHALSRTVSEIPLGLTPAYPVVLKRNQFERFLALDPVARIFFDAWNWNLSTNEIHRSIDQTYHVEKGDLVLEVIECLDMMETCLRGKETNYLIDLFTTASLLVEMLACGRTSLSPLRYLDPLSSNVQKFYRASSLTALNVTPLSEVWRHLQGSVEKLRVRLNALIEDGMYSREETT